MGTRRPKPSTGEHVVDAWFWTNPKHTALSHDALHLFAYLWTAPECTVHGLFVFEPHVVAHRAKFPVDGIHGIVGECVRGEVLAFDAPSSTVLLQQKWERAKQVPAARKAAITALANSDSPLVSVFFALYPDLKRPVEAAVRLARGNTGGEIVSNIPPQFPLFMLDPRLEEQWHELVAQWKAMYPAVNVDAALVVAHDWLMKRRGTKQGDKSDVVGFLHNWMRRDDGGRSKKIGARVGREEARHRFTDTNWGH